MKPKTTYQRHVLALSKKLPEITDKQKQWAFEHCFEALGLASKKRVWCLECGEVFSYEAPMLITAMVGSEVTCPHCGRELKLKDSRMKNYDEKWYYTIATTIEGFQVFRHFIVTKSMRRDIAGLKRPYFTIHEAVQNWIDDLGRDTIIARPCKPLFYCDDAWDFTKPMEIRPYRDVPKYNINARFIYPRRSILPKIKRNGYVSSFCDCAPSDFCRAVLRDREAEMLVKNRQYDLLRHKIARGYHEFTMPFAHAIRIANRRKYIVRDASMWYDYLHLLEYFHLDTHNAHYVCPKGLPAGDEIADGLATAFLADLKALLAELESPPALGVALLPACFTVEGETETEAGSPYAGSLTPARMLNVCDYVAMDLRDCDASEVASILPRIPYAYVRYSLRLLLDRNTPAAVEDTLSHGFTRIFEMEPSPKK